MEVGVTLWQLINIIYKSKWDRLHIDENNYSFQRCIAHYFVCIKSTTEYNSKETSKDPTSPQAAPSTPIPSSNIPITSSQLSKESLVKLKQSKLPTRTNNKKSYAQASKLNVKDIIYIKNAFPNFPLKKIIEVNNILNILKLVKSYIKMTTKEPLRKQIIFIDQSNMSIIVNHANTFMRNINNCLHEHNSNVVANFIRLEDYGVLITTNQAASSQDMNIIEKCIKKSESINSEHVNSPQLSKSKLYLKILGLSYLVEDTNQPISSKIVGETI